MAKDLPYPKSFPTEAEAQFLKLAYASDDEFGQLWKGWMESADWQHIDVAVARLLPYLYLRIEKLGIRDSFTERIKGVYKSTWLKNQLYIRATKEVLELTNAAQIPVLVLKGVPLLTEVYGDVGARALGDADLLVRPEDGKRLQELLASHGWQYAKEWATDRHNPSLSIYRITKATELNNGKGVDLDVHYNIFAADHGVSLFDVLRLRSLPSLSYPELFWKHAVPTEVSGVPCLRLSAEDTLIHLLVHGAEGNTYRGFRWVLDALLIIDRLSIDWDLLVAHATEFRYTLELYLGLLYLQENFSAPIPEKVLSTLKAHPVSDATIRTYYTRANTEHAKRFRGLGNLPLLWYAYWKFEPSHSLKLLHFPSFVLKSWGLRSYGELAQFAIKHYARKLNDKDPELLKGLQKVSVDSMYVVLGKVLSFAASFVVITLMARFVPREVVGSYNYLMAVLAIVSILTLPGMNDAYTRAVGRGHMQTAKAMMRTRLLFGLSGSVLSVLIGIGTWISGNPELGLAFITAAIFIPLTDTFSTFAINHWQGRRKFARSALMGAAYYAGIAAFTVSAVLISDELVPIAITTLLGQAVVGFLLYRMTDTTSGTVDTESQKLGLHLTVMQSFGILARNLDKVVVWSLLGPAMVAVYALAYTPFSKAHQMIPIATIALPYLSAQRFTRIVRNKIITYTGLLFLLSVPGTALVILLAPYLYATFFPLYPESVVYFQILFAGIAFVPVVLMRTALIAFNQTRALYMLEVGMPLLSIALFTGLGFFFGLLGVAFGILLGSIIGAALTFLLFIRVPVIDSQY